MSSSSENRKKENKKEYNNLLINEKSPYLIQHAHNPVNWHPWGEKAFDKAKKENKPIFLSIGYSTCHWCHVMAHESFEDPEIGQMLNEVFIPIKVDREERPDIDSIFMNVCQMMTGGGGWPLTIILTPDSKPFFAGTYFPKEGRYGNVGLKEIILKVKELWKTNPQEALQSAQKIMGVLEKISESQPEELMTVTLLDETYHALKEGFDHEYGGFGMIQKFPTPHNLYFLMRYWKRTSKEDALEMVLKTLNQMSYGGIFDHVGFGFHRYTVDPQWLVPHFEKMLYDQALISMAYLEAFQITKNPHYKEIAEKIFEYVLRDMQSPEGGFYSAEDADSEGEEGKFYLWEKDELIDLLGADALLIIDIFNISSEGNFKEESTGLKTGKNIIHMNYPLEDNLNKYSTIYNISPDEIKLKIKKSLRKLFDAREKRVRPHKDDKILVDWNGLMIAALAMGSRVLSNEKYLKAAQKATDFILSDMISETKTIRLMHRYRDGESAVPGNIDDYAFFIWGLLELYQTTFNIKYLEIAFSLNETLMNHFRDAKNGAFFFTADDAEKVLLRKKESYDSALPSGNSAHMLNLLKMSQLSENLKLKDTALDLEKYFSAKIKRSPLAHTNLLNAIDFRLGPSYGLTVVCPPGSNPSESKDYLEIQSILTQIFIPNLTLLLKADTDQNELFEKIDALKSKNSLDNKCTYYLCTSKECKAPTTELKEILAILK